MGCHYSIHLPHTTSLPVSPLHSTTPPPPSSTWPGVTTRISICACLCDPERIRPLWRRRLGWVSPWTPSPSEPAEHEGEDCTRLTMTGKMMAATVDLRIQSTAKHSICTRVKRWIRRRGTCRRKAWSGWCLAGIRKSLQRSQNW